MTLGHVHLIVRDLEPAVTLQALGDQAVAPTQNAVGLYHSAFELQNPREFAEAMLKLERLKVPYSLVDHRISWAMYTRDPDQNGVEIYLDRRHSVGGRQVWEGHSLPLTRAQIVDAAGGVTSSVSAMAQGRKIFAPEAARHCECTLGRASRKAAQSYPR